MANYWTLIVRRKKTLEIKYFQQQQKNKNNKILKNICIKYLNKDNTNEKIKSWQNYKKLKLEDKKKSCEQLQCHIVNFS